MDSNRKVRIAVEGFRCRAADAFVYTKSALVENRSIYFSVDRSDFLFADTVFPRSSICCPLFKGAEARTPEMRRASVVYNRYRVEVEHSIGLEKAGFQSLRCIPISIRDHDSHQEAMMWCKYCTVIHNMAVSENDPQWGWRDEDTEPPYFNLSEIHPDLGDGVELTQRVISDLVAFDLSS